MSEEHNKIRQYMHTYQINSYPNYRAECLTSLHCLTLTLRTHVHVIQPRSQGFLSPLSTDHVPQMVIFLVVSGLYLDSKSVARGTENGHSNKVSAVSYLPVCHWHVAASVKRCTSGKIDFIAFSVIGKLINLRRYSMNHW